GHRRLPAGLRDAGRRGRPAVGAARRAAQAARLHRHQAAALPAPAERRLPRLTTDEPPGGFRGHSAAASARDRPMNPLEDVLVAFRYLTVLPLLRRRVAGDLGPAAGSVPGVA